MSAAAADRGPLAALVAYEQEVVFGYQVVLNKAQLTHEQRTTAQRFGAQAEQAAAALRRALRGAGGTPSAPPNPALAPPPADTSARGYLRQVVAAEESSLQAYFTAFQSLTDPDHIAGAAAFMAQAGRRLVVLRRMSGEQLLPRAFETGGA